MRDTGCGMRDAGAPHPASRVGKGRGMRVAESSEIALLGFRTFTLISQVYLAMCIVYSLNLSPETVFQNQSFHQTFCLPS